RRNFECQTLSFHGSDILVFAARALEPVLERGPTFDVAQWLVLQPAWKQRGVSHLPKSWRLRDSCRLPRVRQPGQAGFGCLFRLARALAAFGWPARRERGAHALRRERNAPPRYRALANSPSPTRRSFRTCEHPRDSPRSSPFLRARPFWHRGNA